MASFALVQPGIAAADRERLPVGFVKEAAELEEMHTKLSKAAWMSSK